MTLDDLTFGGPFRLAQLRYLRDGGGFHRECRAPGADLSDLPKEMRDRIAAEWTADVIEAYRNHTAATAPDPDPEPQPDPRDEKIAAIEARVAKLEEAEDSRKTLTTRN